MFTRSAITPPEVNGFGWNLGNSESIAWSCPLILSEWRECKNKSIRPMWWFRSFNNGARGSVMNSITPTFIQHFYITTHGLCCTHWSTSSVWLCGQNAKHFINMVSSHSHHVRTTAAVSRSIRHWYGSLIREATCIIPVLLLLFSGATYRLGQLYASHCWLAHIGSRPSDHYFRSVCRFVCLSVCLFVQSFSPPSLIRFRSNLDICYTSGSSCVP